MVQLQTFTASDYLQNYQLLGLKKYSWRMLKPFIRQDFDILPTKLKQLRDTSIEKRMPR